MGRKKVAKVDFDLSVLKLDELIKTQEKVSEFIESIKSKKIVIEKKAGSKK